MPFFKFKVDSALLRELGERLVGKPHIALAELVKNSYDADALEVEIRIGRNLIEVRDNGHGMTEEEFNAFWMRIGSPHKDRQRVSRQLKRPLTGSKGVGRLAGQFLAHKMEIVTVAESAPATEFVGTVNWNLATKAKELTEARVNYVTNAASARFPGNSRHGTIVRLRGLNQDWNGDAVRDLAREIWWLKPPFRKNPSKDSAEQPGFDVRLISDAEKEAEFSEQMEAILRLHYARITGELKRRKKDGAAVVDLAIEWEDGTRLAHEYPIDHCHLHRTDFEIRVYHLHRRQKYGVKVGKAQEYLNQYGNVHIYDAGFHLPYYGPDVDWLQIEVDHAHRKSRSQLLPEKLQVAGGLEYLPTQSRLLGVVNVNTGFEREYSRKRQRKPHDYLKIQITRDRLVENKAFVDLFTIVRYALDYYATRETLRVYRAKQESAAIQPVAGTIDRVREALRRVKDELEPDSYASLEQEIAAVVSAIDADTAARIAQANLLGALATAGISALSFQHEMHRQFRTLEIQVESLKDIDASDKSGRDRLREISTSLQASLESLTATQSLFSNISDPANRQTKKRFVASAVVKEVGEQIGSLLHGIPVSTEEMDDELRLPIGAYAEWSAIFQNVFLNAANAMLDSTNRRIDVSTEKIGNTRIVLVEDTGRGVELTTAEGLFEPFVRTAEISDERKALGYGGTGLGLTIVRMLAGNLGCHVAFVKPSKGHATAFRLSWSEQP